MLKQIVFVSATMQLALNNIFNTHKIIYAFHKKYIIEEVLEKA